MKMLLVLVLFISFFSWNMQIGAMDKQLLRDIIFQDSMIAGKDPRGDHKRDLLEKEKHKKPKPLSPKSRRLEEKELIAKFLAKAIESSEE